MFGNINMTHKLPVINFEPQCCTCENDAVDDRTCPYSEEICNDSDFTCNCCKYCEYQCAMDI
jgi:hypothetical protein